ncbi:Ig-like domain-containing protein [Deinococcus planocerae]|uniref:Ig-like domain-containing protein n=1 Tax=Deinococcus planocerae TaxID=1737569 RepID=UPI001C63DEDC|nr:Ig-like domain-containing protein [Deinococcus planocerae]
MKNFRILALVTGVSLLLAACNGTRTPSAVATVEVTAPSDLNVKLNDTATTTRFTAVAKAQDGSVLTGKTVTWESSNPDVASIDANGVVTAKHFGETTIRAMVDGVAGNRTATLRTYGLEVFAGIRDGGSDTAMFFRYRTKTGRNPAQVSFTVTGPAGWGGGQSPAFAPAVSTYFPNGDGTGLHWFEFGWTKTGTLPAVIGDYAVRFNVDGEEWVSSARITSLTNSSAQPTNIRVTKYDGSSVTAAWDDVTPGGSYLAEVIGFQPPLYVKNAAAVIPAPGLTPGNTSYVAVHALSLDTTAPVTTVLPGGQFDVRFNVGAFTP